MLILINRFKNILNSVLLFILSVIIIVMVSSVLWQIVSRAILHTPSAITEELTRFSLIWLALLGSVYAFSQKQHISITILEKYASLHLRKYISLFICLIILAFSIQVLLIGGIKIMNVAKIQLSPTLRMPMSYVYSVLPISGFLWSFYSLLDVIVLIADRKKGCDV